jgi:hypothetical protein
VGVHVGLLVCDDGNFSDLYSVGGPFFIFAIHFLADLKLVVTVYVMLA